MARKESAMRATILALLSATAMSPTLALAQQSASEQRMQELQQQQSVREVELRQRLEQVERNVENLDLRLRTEENINRIQQPLRPVEPRYPQVAPVPPLLVSSTARQNARTSAEAAMAAELAASNARLRALNPPTEQ